MGNFLPSYMRLYESGELHKRRDYLIKRLEKCDLCPRQCKVNRLKTVGSCRVGVLKGENGAGGVFFSNCTMRCVYCQNFNFSQLGFGKKISTESLAKIFLKLQNEMKAANLDLVTATPYLPFIFDALIYAIERGFRLPIVWNTSSYESIETLKLMKDVVDIYLADIRYTSNIVSKRYSGVKDYWSNAQLAIKEMYRQIGETFLVDEKSNVLKRGIIIRILVLPKFLKYEISEKIHISLMDQYVPVYKAKNYEKLSRYLYKSEYKEVVDYLYKLGFENGWIQTHNLKEGNEVFSTSQ